MRWPKIFYRGLFGFPRFIQRCEGDGRLVEQRFDGLAHRRFRRSAKVGLEFEAIKRGWIVARRDHHPANGPFGLYSKGNCGCGRRLIGEENLEAVAEESLRDALAKLIG